MEGKMNKNRLLQTATLLFAVGISGYLFASDHGAGNSPFLPVVSNVTWQAECAGCHTLYHPALLPERSWRKVMAGLDKHFGANASLDGATKKEIVEFLATHAADHSDQSRARKIGQSIPAGETPILITQTAYFTRKHDEVRADVWRRKAIGSKANCAACHPGADKGSFNEHELRVPK